MKKSFFYQVLAIIILVISTGAFSAFVFPDTRVFSQTTGWFLVLVGLYPFLKGIKKKRLDLFEPVYLFTAYFILEMGVRGLWDLQYGGHILSRWYDIGPSYYYLLNKVFLYSILALAVFYLGYYSKLGVLFANSLPKLPKVYWIKPQLFIAAGLSFFPAFFSLFSILNQSSYLGANYFLYSLTILPFMGLSLLYINSFLKKKRFLEFFFVFLIIFFASFLFFFFHGGKTIIFEAGIFVLVFYNYFKKFISLKKAFVICLLLFFISPIIIGYKSLGNWKKTQNYFIFSLSHPEQIIKPILNRSYGADAFALILDKTPELEIGGSFSELFWFYVPRFLWQEKPPNYPILFGKIYSIPGPFVIPTLIGELYLNFAWVGIIIGFLLTGIIFRTIYCYLIQRDKSETAILLYAIIVPTLLLFPQGAIGESISRILIKLIFTFLIVSIMMVKISFKKEQKSLVISH